MELLKQDQYRPMPVMKQIVSLFAGTNGYLDPYPVKDVKRYEEEMLSYVESSHRAFLDNLAKMGKFDDGLRNGLKAILDNFKNVFKA
jgi:F-type H+-transporting ATPase subunit alpha